MGKLYGYIRVSTTEQNEDRQLYAMQEHDVPQENIFCDKQSGKDFKRPGYQALMERLQPGDVLCVASIDRLGRNYVEIQQQWELLTKRKHVDVVIFNMPLLDTRLFKDLVGTFIADLVLLIMSYVAQNEHENIHARQAEGIARAKAKGVRFGRPPKPLPREVRRALDLCAQGALNTSEAARLSGKGRSTFCYYMKRAGLRPKIVYPHRKNRDSHVSVTSADIVNEVKRMLVPVKVLKEAHALLSGSREKADEEMCKAQERKILRQEKKLNRSRAEVFLRAYRLWQEGVLQASEAAKLPGIRREEFLRFVKNVEKSGLAQYLRPESAPSED
ncbi:MAG: recombinase family protein [Desulfovibrio sp.]|nr:recombinase family protein [Desulfovibrio sp.]